MKANKVTESYQKLEIYSALYILVGELELFLRSWIPHVLSNASSTDPQAWLNSFEFKGWEQNKLHSAKNQARLYGRESDFVQFLTFGFWRGILHRENYTQYWTKEIYKIFKDPKEAIKFEYCTKVSNSITNVHKLRNRVAHYDFSRNLNLDAEIENLLWLKRQFPDSEINLSTGRDTPTR